MRLAIALMLSMCALAVAGGNAQAGNKWELRRQQRAQVPPRYTRDTMAQWHVYRDRHGEIQYRKAYPGYSANFPTPAYLFYGYPKSGDFSGMGIDLSP